MLIDQLNRQLDMHQRKLASLERNAMAAEKRVQKEREIIRKLELEINKLSPESRQLHEGENLQSQEEEQKRRNPSAVDIPGVPQELMPLQELIIQLQQKVIEVNQRQQNGTKPDETLPLIKEEAATTVEEKAVQEQIDGEQEKTSLSALDIPTVRPELMPLRNLIIELQQKVTEINQRQPKETKSDGEEQFIKEDAAIMVAEQVPGEKQQLHQEEQSKRNLSAFEVVGALAPLQELMMNLQQKITEINQRPQKETKFDIIGQVPEQ